MRFEDATIEWVPVEELVPYDNNAKRHTRQQIDAIEASIREFGFRAPVVAWHDEDGRSVVVAGHARTTAARNLGMEKVPVVFCDDLDDAQRRALTLVDNQTTMMTGWDEDMLAYELDTLAETFDMTDFGFTDEAGDDLSVVEEDEVPDVEEGRAKRGDLFRLGNHLLMCGDATSRDDVRRLIGHTSADLLLTDPPYNVALGKHMRPSEVKCLRRRTDGLVIDNDSWDDDSAFVEFLSGAFELALNSLRPGGAFYVWYSSSQSENFFQAARNAGMTVRQTLVWAKSTFTLFRQDYQWRHEPCLYGWKDGAAHYFFDSRVESTVVEDAKPDPRRMTKAELVEFAQSLMTERRASTVLEFDKPSVSEEHPTMKPVKLFAYLIRNSTRRGEVVLDPFAGSGTSLIAAEQLGRRCLCMELNPHFADVIIARYEQMTGDEAVRVREG